MNLNDENVTQKRETEKNKKGCLQLEDSDKELSQSEDLGSF